MQKETKQKMHAYTAQIAQANGLTQAEVTSEKFNVTPTMQQKLENKIQLSHDFLQKINIVPVTEPTGQALGLGVTSTIAGRTDTTSKDREGIEFTALDAQDYACKQTNFDTALSYARLDMWAKFPDFAQRIAQQKIQRVALDRIMIGFNGEKCEKTTNRSTYPLLQDVNIGWLKHIETKAKNQVIDGMETKNLDKLVLDAINAAIPEEYRNDSAMVVIMNANLADMLKAQLYNNDKATEQAAAMGLLPKTTVAGLKIVVAPFFPEKSILITRLDNLSIYYQDGKMRRQLEDQPRRDRYVDYMSSNECYVVENLNAVCYLKNITLSADLENTVKEKRDSERGDS